MGTFRPLLTEQQLSLPADVRRDGARLFDVSMWLLGRDVRHEGNLLLRRGFTRERIPEGQEGTSAYSLALEGGVGLTLWGFGALCRAWGECIFVPRDGFAPRLVEASRVAGPVFQSAGLGPLREPWTPREHLATRAALGVLAEWLAGHEEWVRETVGLAYRRECVEARRKAAPVPVEALPEAWRRLAARLHVRQPVESVFSAPAFGA